MTFWLIGLALAALGFLPVVLTLWRGHGQADAAPELGVYRDQLAEIDRDIARGVLSGDEAERTRAEVARRLLAADRARRAPAGEAPRAVRLAGGAAVLVLGSAGVVALYVWLGAPGYPDLPIEKRLADAAERRADRPSQAEAETRAAASLPPPVEPDPDFAQLLERLRSAMETRQEDPQGWRLLARNEARLGNYPAAARAQQRLVALLGTEAPAEERSFLGEMLVLAAGGFVTREAEAAFDAALARDPGDGRAAFYKGLTLAQTGRPDLAFRIWRPLLESAPPGAPWVAPIRARIGQVAALAGIDYELPPEPAGTAPPGPSAEDMAAARDMDPAARQQMIRSMVERLGERLATEGGPAPEWARLIRALGVLGERERAQAIFTESRQVFANQPDDIAALEEAARAAGVLE